MIWYEDGRDQYVFSSGRRMYANGGILGLGPGSDSTVTEGYDGYFEESADSAWTTEERQQLAAMMIRRWRAWAAR